jgi:cytochrome c
MKQGTRLLLAAALAAGVGSVQAADAAQVSTTAGCSACHAIDKKLVGPSWKAVAARYRGDAAAPTLLADRVRKGSAGIWGQVPMVPVNAKTIGDTDLKAVIAWVLNTPS